ncbi:Elongation of very long chain fatty acids protein 4 [Nymphon striatum]|nr:Elongation of very long chain fatty acids protein 4 [Nymphon striatum]KAG1652468.1 Elongation of very long chain fatty acids protein 4 [Nymphon striatum]
MLNVIWYFWISKFVELLDTIYFVLRKKDRQVTVLHVYHHCTMIFNVWITIKLSPVGHFTFIGFTNSFVHFPMYAYYGLAAIGPHMQKYLGWKKYITTIQLIQFVLNIFHGTQVLFNNCDVSLTIAYISVFQSFVFLILFLNFYHHTYVNIRKNARASNLKENMSINNSNGNLKSYCSWPTVNGYENVTLVNGNNSQSLHTKISSNGNSSNYMESSMEKLKKRPRKE